MRQRFTYFGPFAGARANYALNRTAVTRLGESGPSRAAAG